MRLPQLFLITLAACAAATPMQAAPKTPYHRAVDPFVAELNRQCPGRRLQNLNAGDLDLIQEGFFDTLPLAQRHAIEDAVGRRCALVEAGLTCANNATLATYRRLHLLKSFTGAACASRWTCKGFADCEQAPP